MGRNVTTYEHFRQRYSNTGNPYSRGVWNNFGQVLCASVPPRWEPLWEKQRAEDEAVAAADASQQPQQKSPLQVHSQTQQQLNIGTNGDISNGGSSGGGRDNGGVGGGNLSPNYHEDSIIGGSRTASSYTLDDVYDESDGHSNSVKADDGHVLGSRINSNGQVDIELGPLTQDGEGDFSTPVQTPRNNSTLSLAARESAAPPEDVAALELLQSPRPPPPPPPNRGQ